MFGFGEVFVGSVLEQFWVHFSETTVVVKGTSLESIILLALGLSYIYDG